MMEILKKFKAVVFAAIALFLYLFGYRQAKETAEKEQLKGENNALKIAKKARNSLSNSVLVVSGYFKQDTTATAADKMLKVLEAEAATQKSAI